MKDPLPVPDQLEKQLSKCKTVRDADTFYKSRDKTKEVSECSLLFVVLCDDGIFVCGMEERRGEKKCTLPLYSMKYSVLVCNIRAVDCI